MEKTVSYLMPETYLKPCQISKMMRHIEDSGIVRTVYSGIFSDIKQYSAMFRHTEALLRHNETYSELCVSLAYKTMPYSEL